MVTSLKQDLFDFAIARRACRPHVFKQATIRHEPRKLIDGSLWGPNLFPAALVQAAIDAAAAANQSLRSRWNLSYKRRFQENVGASTKAGKKPKGTSQARGGGTAQYRIPKRTPPQQQQQQPQYAVLQPVPSTSRASQGQPLIVLQPSQSPAFHAPYEQASSFPGFQQPRGGGGSQRRGRGRGNSQARGRGNSQKRVRGRGNTPQ